MNLASLSVALFVSSGMSNGKGKVPPPPLLKITTPWNQKFTSPREAVLPSLILPYCSIDCKRTMYGNEETNDDDDNEVVEKGSFVLGGRGCSATNPRCDMLSSRDKVG